MAYYFVLILLSYIRVVFIVDMKWFDLIGFLGLRSCDVKREWGKKRQAKTQKMSFLSQ